jgi:hypothetical protein
MVVVFGLEDGGSEDVGYGYVIRIILYLLYLFALTFVNVLLVLVEDGSVLLSFSCSDFALLI